MDIFTQFLQQCKDPDAVIALPVVLASFIGLARMCWLMNKNHPERLEKMRQAPEEMKLD